MSVTSVLRLMALGCPYHFDERPDAPLVSAEVKAN
jgi:hypothetical protein